MKNSTEHFFIPAEKVKITISEPKTKEPEVVKRIKRALKKCQE